ncbi:ABC transporter substrate-binding protein [Olsenella sp. DNF00959]|uniref:ABC transporter substrate-binding protein n=2 Tax=Olsenella TaxID=133925 RepID=UPI0007802BD1|nr:ABC transporter substrate-binding protein [Olsenella sp. DNF00959]KXB63919.1 Tat pathway signal sequence domain protein [Olsenella sp. DNF00959]
MSISISRRSFLASCGLGLAAGLAGCSAQGGGSAGGTAGSATEAGYTLVEPGKLTMISNFYFPPFVSMNADTGDYEGFDVDLYKAVCEKLGLEPNILPTVQFDTIVPTIKQGGKADVSLGAVTITDKRLQEIDFSDPYLDSNQAIVVKQGSAATTADALNASGTQIAVQSGTTGEAWSRENLPNATIVPLDDIIQCLTGIQTGLYAASVCDLPVASYEISSAYADLVIPDGGQIPTGEQYGIVVSKDNPKLTQAINDALVELQSDGTQDQIEQKWFGSTI